MLSRITLTLGNSSSGTALGTPGASAVIPPTPTLLAQNGAVFNAGIVPFQGGGVINQRTRFGFEGGIGELGEASPEAILPLKRIGAELGVLAEVPNVVVNVPNIPDGAAPVNITIINEVQGVDVSVTERINPATLERIITATIKEVVTKDLNSGGTLSRTFGKTFAVRQQGIRRG